MCVGNCLSEPYVAISRIINTGADTGTSIVSLQFTASLYYHGWRSLVPTHLCWMWQNASQIDQARPGETKGRTEHFKSKIQWVRVWCTCACLSYFHVSREKVKATQNENACSPQLTYGHNRLLLSPPFPPSIWYDAVAVPQQNPSGNVRVFMSKAPTNY